MVSPISKISIPIHLITLSLIILSIVHGSQTGTLNGDFPMSGIILLGVFFYFGGGFPIWKEIVKMLNHGEYNKWPKQNKLEISCDHCHNMGIVDVTPGEIATYDNPDKPIMGTCSVCKYSCKTGFALEFFHDKKCKICSGDGLYWKKFKLKKCKCIKTKCLICGKINEDISHIDNKCEYCPKAIIFSEQLV